MNQTSLNLINSYIPDAELYEVDELAEVQQEFIDKLPSDFEYLGVQQQHELLIVIADEREGVVTTLSQQQTFVYRYGL